MELYLFDPLEDRRPWEELLPAGFVDCRKRRGAPEFIRKDGGELEQPAVLVVHWNQWAQGMPLLEESINNKQVYILLVGGGVVLESQHPRVFTWPKSLERDTYAEFTTCFARFWAKAREGHVDFGLLLPSQKPKETIAAMAILCQGYLAVQPASDLGEEAGKARAAMGCVEGFADSLRQTGAEWPTQEQIDETKRGKWWRDTLGVKAKCDKAKIESQLTTEWGDSELPSDLTELLGCLDHDEAIVKPETVRGAYQVISKKLGAGGAASQSPTA